VERARVAGLHGGADHERDIREEPFFGSPLSARIRSIHLFGPREIPSGGGPADDA
jgi:hypothetical protein